MEQTLAPWDKAVRKDPHSYYARLREAAPVHGFVGPVTGNTFWFVLRYGDAQAMLKDPAFTKSYRRVASPEELAAMESDPASILHSRHLLGVDPPEHTRLRSLVHKAFTPRIVRELAPRIEEIAHSLLQAMADTGGGDLITAYAFPLPMMVIAELLGIPGGERDQFRDWSKTLLYEFDPQKRALAAMELARYFHAIFDARRSAPEDDLISGLVVAEEEGERLDAQELLSMVFLLLVAGHETTVNLIATGMLELLQHPDQLALLRREPALMESAVEELLRYHGPVENSITRWALDDYEWRGQELAKGEAIFATLLSANRDPELFDDPDRLDITRQPNRHIAFGHGIHYCLGAPLARLEGAIALRALLDRFPSLALAQPAAELEWSDSINLRGVRALPLRW